MQDILLFVFLPLLLTFALLAYRTGGPFAAIAYLKSMPGAAKGIGLFLGVAFTVALIASFIPRAHSESWKDDVQWFDYAEVYIGMDWTFEQSPQCRDDGIDKYSTSNGGFRFNVMTLNRFQWNAKYTHHSCAFNSDRNGYDGAGTEFVLRIW